MRVRSLVALGGVWALSGCLDLGDVQADKSDASSGGSTDAAVPETAGFGGSSATGGDGADGAIATAGQGGATSAAWPVVAGSRSSLDLSNVSTHHVELPSGISPGDLLIVVFGLANDDPITFPPEWTAADNTLYSSDGQTAARVAYRVADGSESSPINVISGTAHRSAHQAFRITDAGAGVSVSMTVGDDAQPDPPAESPPWGAEDTLWIAWAVTKHAATAYPANYSDGTEVGSGDGTDYVHTATARRGWHAASEDPDPFTSNNDGWISGTIAVQPK